MIFESCSLEQVNSTHNLYVLLRGLRVIGVVKTVTKKIPMTDFGKPFKYKLSYVSYDESMKNRLTADEQFTRYAISVAALEACTRPTD